MTHFRNRTLVELIVRAGREKLTSSDEGFSQHLGGGGLVLVEGDKSHFSSMHDHFQPSSFAIFAEHQCNLYLHEPTGALLTTVISDQ